LNQKQSQMTKVIFNASMSLDGFIAKRNDDCTQLHSWYFNGDTELPGTPFKISKASAELMSEAATAVGAMVTGRRNYNVASAWGGHPPLGVHHFVVTHKPDTTWVKKDSPFTFVTEGVTEAIKKAKKLAGTKDVCISSANILQQALKAGLVDEIHIDLVPVLLGDGIPLFVNTSHPALEQLRVVNGIAVTHLGFKVKR
jgi:dihydrofolate reductase